MFCFFGHKARGILAPHPGIEPTPPALEGSLNHWTAREVPNIFLSFFLFLAVHLILIILLKRWNEFHSTTLFLRPVSIINKSQQNLITDYQFIKNVDLSICSGDFNLDSWLNTDGSDLLDNLRRMCRSMSRLWILI